MYQLFNYQKIYCLFYTNTILARSIFLGFTIIFYFVGRFKMNDIERIIVQEIQARPFLYNSMDRLYIDKQRRTVVFNEIAAVVNQAHPEIVDEVDGNITTNCLL